MRGSTRLTAASVFLLVVVTGLLPAQQSESPLAGVWLLSHKPVPLAMLLVFQAETYEILGRISYHGADITYTKLKEDDGPKPYTIGNLVTEGQLLSFAISLEGFDFDAVGPAPGSGKVPGSIFLLVAGRSWQSSSRFQS